jgi:hypothetical protein
LPRVGGALGGGPSTTSSPDGPRVGYAFAPLYRGPAFSQFGRRVVSCPLCLAL